MTGSIQIRGTAHPPPPRHGGRRNAADLSRAEIASTNIAGRPLLNEHDSSSRVGTCLASWQGSDGSLRIAASVDDPNAIQQVRDGTLRGLSLGTDMVMSEGGDVLYRNQAELSICEEGRRPGTWVDTIDGRTVHAVACFSKQQQDSARAPSHPRIPARPALTADNPRRPALGVKAPRPRCFSEPCRSAR